MRAVRPFPPGPGDAAPAFRQQVAAVVEQAGIGDQGLATSRPATVLFCTIAAKCWPSVSRSTWPERSVRWAARMPSQAAPIWDASRSQDRAARTCW
jgi:hypothetical protein